MSGTVLIVDDDVASNEWVVEALREAGFETRTATNGAEALRSIGAMTEPPCVVLLDLMMPLLDGWDVIASLVRHPVRPNVIVMSAYCKGGVPAGAVAALPKPVHPDALVEAVRQWSGKGAAGPRSPDDPG